MFRLKIRIRYHFTQAGKPTLMFFLLLIMLVILTQAHTRASVLSAPSSADEIPAVRQYYATRKFVNANEARTACASGYHFASIWEISDTSSLKYNKDLGVTSSDSGEGPPTTSFFLFNPSLKVVGWVRTGYNSSSVDLYGRANCMSWQSNRSDYWGTVANLPSTWTSGDQDIGVWNIGVRICNSSLVRVWCVQDDSVRRVFLPIIIRNVSRLSSRQ